MGCNQTIGVNVGCCDCERTENEIIQMTRNEILNTNFVCETIADEFQEFLVMPPE